jgi:peptide/nickel transport system permease protein
MRILQFILKRVIYLIPILIGLTLLTFTMTRLIPADPARQIAGVHATKDAVERIRVKWGFDRPIHEQYLLYLKGLTQGDLGRSSHSRHPVLEDLILFIPATAELALAALFIMILLGIPLGVTSAVFKDKGLDHVSRIGALAGVSLPAFWLALVFQLVFYRRLDWLPAGGRIADSIPPPDTITGLFLVDSLLTGNAEAFFSSLQHIIMPAVVLSLAGLAAVTRMTRASMLEVMNKDYIKAARAKGVPEWKVIYKHALKNALIPVTTIIGMWTGTLLGGAFIVEYIFYWPGIGFYGTSGILTADFAATMGVALFVAMVYVLANLTVDILYMFIDPRLRYGQ